MSRFQDLRRSLNTVSAVLETVMLRGVYLLLVPPILFLLSWKLALLALVSLPVTTAIGVATARVVRRYWRESAEAGADLNAFQIEMLSNIALLKSATAESRVYGHADRHTETVLRKQLRATGFSTLLGGVNGAVRACGVALYTWFGWMLILRGE